MTHKSIEIPLELQAYQYAKEQWQDWHEEDMPDIDEARSLIEDSLQKQYGQHPRQAKFAAQSALNTVMEYSVLETKGV